MKNNKKRMVLFVTILIIILLGLGSRKISIIPLWVGDVLWAVMIYMMIHFIWINTHPRTIMLISLSLCYAIELSQLYHAPWIDAIRHTSLGALILGQGFLWSDLFAYIVGCLLGYFLNIGLHRYVR